MKTPDEIKKGLEHCSTKKPCTSCPMWDECKEEASLKPLWDNAIAYILQLEAANAERLTRCERLERERDAAVDYLAMTKDCKTCKHFPHAASEEPCRSCGVRQGHWEWRGAKEE